MFGIEGGRRKKSRWPLIAVGTGLVVVLGLVIALTPVGGRVKRGLKVVFGNSESAPVTDKRSSQPEAEEPVEPPKPEEPKTPLERDPDPIFPKGRLTPPDGVNIRALSKGINLEVEFVSEEGGLASVERKDDKAYRAHYKLQVRMPRASTTLEELSRVNQYLPEILPSLKDVLPKGSISAWYKQLYANKAERLKANVGRLDEVITRHNFYDCETMLNLRDQSTGRRAFLLQAEMDVVSDGSDGDRLPTMPDRIVNSTNYQPFTSYGWPKSSRTPNPMLAGWTKRIGNAKQELAAAGTTAARKAWLRDRLKMLERGVADMKVRSYLIAEHDPFVVMPTFIVKDREDAYAPNMGDYAVVIIGRTIYPAIVGDSGPTYKVGEASLRMAKEIDANANPYRRPISDLTVTYLVFPRSADERRRAPDYAHWRKRCQELLDEFGGLGEGLELHEWTKTLPE